MKKLLWISVLLLLLCGCTEPENFETMTDLVYDVPEQTAGQICLELPEEATACVLGDPLSGAVYLLDDYSITVSTLQGGDLNATLRQVTGFDSKKLQMLQRMDGDYKRYEMVWAAAGEGTDQVCRAVMLDDGAYHYVVTFMADAGDAAALTSDWKQILDSFSVSTAP